MSAEAESAAMEQLVAEAEWPSLTTQVAVDVRMIRVIAKVSLDRLAAVERELPMIRKSLERLANAGLPSAQ